MSESDNAYYMMQSSHRLGKTSEAIMRLIAKIRPNSNIKVTCPDVEKMESDLKQAREEIESLKEQLRDERKYRQECLRSANIDVSNLQSALDVAVEGYEFYADKYNYTRDSASGYSAACCAITEDGASKANEALDKIKQIREKK